ncbi:hypothetical protein PR048_020908 [Dryococelus australis]|uniref:DDE-1 domain-containing protein n=1 Tax=Dryococelus australis TaxID=614101 RepID=A0ABQ9GWQ4_9NEOP|nr:hypothetical protein PR048_020908 [Dryococelus australis]
MLKDIFERNLCNFQAQHKNGQFPLLDGHSTHVHNLSLFGKARECGVVIVCIPPHCTHRIQPIDLGVMKPLSTYYDEETTSWLRSHPGRVVTMFQISEILGKPFLRAETMSNSINNYANTVNTPNDHPWCMPTTADTGISPANDEPGGSQHHVSSHQDDSNLNDSMNISAFTTPPKQIMPIPHVGRIQLRQKTHTKGRRAVITSSPYKTELEVKLSRKDKVQGEKTKKNILLDRKLKNIERQSVRELRLQEQRKKQN